MEEGEVLFWIDTLCCPVAPPQAKAMALNQMKTPYSNASHVLVLHSSLRDTEVTDLDPAEEGALPQNLWFQFKDSMVDLRQTWLKVAKNTGFGRIGLVLDITGLYRGPRHFLHAEKEDRGVSLASVDGALQFRSVSIASDEPLLIGGLLNLDTTRILDGPVDSRMQRLWSLISLAPGGIPKNILFTRGSRLHQSGFRWAPALLLASEGGRDGNLRNTDVLNDGGYLTSTGLRVRLAGFPIRIAWVPKGLPKNPWNMFDQMDENNILCRIADGKWLLLHSKYCEISASQLCMVSLRAIFQSQVLLLASAFQFDGHPEHIPGLLVHGNGVHNGTPTVVSDMTRGNLGENSASCSPSFASAAQ
ncbi:MAG: hypothetical protein Q9219_005038 [cf. Caloplaca sp. 3 TL-2023]